MLSRLSKVVDFVRGDGIHQLGLLAMFPRRLSEREAAAIAADFLDNGEPVADIDVGTAILALIDRPPTPSEVRRVRQSMTVDEAVRRENGSASW